MSGRAEAADRAVPGFWEGDLIIGKANASQIATLVERTTRFTMLVRIPCDRNAERVAKLLAMKMETLPESMRKSATWDTWDHLGPGKGNGAARWFLGFDRDRRVFL